MTQWISNTKILFKSNIFYQTNNRNITEYFGKDSARNNNISTNLTLNKIIQIKDNNHNKLYTTRYLDKNKEQASTIGTDIKNHSDNRKKEKTNKLDKLTSKLPQPTDTNQIFGTNQAKRNISKKHRPAQNEILDQSNPNYTHKSQH